MYILIQEGSGKIIDFWIGEIGTIGTIGVVGVVGKVCRFRGTSFIWGMCTDGLLELFVNFTFKSISIIGLRIWD